MVSFPKSVVYDDTNKPDWLAVIKENDANPFSLTLTLEDWNRIRFDETNIEGLLVDLNRAVVDAGLSAADVASLLAFMRFTAQRVVLTLNGTGTDNIEIIMPPGVVVSRVVKPDGTELPFFFNTIRNSVVITVTFASEVQIEMLVRSIQVTLNSAVQTITTIMVLTSVLNIMFNQMGELMREVREA
ncbi:MAG: hypothetical protein QXW98_04680 [Candidatus Caldarchaeum sp.]